MSVLKRSTRLGPIAAAEADALKAAHKHEAALAAIAEAGDQFREVKSRLSAQAEDRRQYAQTLLEQADDLKAASNLLAIGQTDTQVREVFAPVN